ncbi:chaperone NapD [Pseudomarimonas arenosa]|uniref:Chaperone NapD n=1 Tax=Pseudomarimonas arenosa TaxID=2774145 RepID=A0AAW3ZMV4_9GAMM|nr:chaperone NapD [Pseudomarimonas arenosa]MBD8527463.1 chaperone NapD [Pseudomarimonas arenosa]
MNPLCHIASLVAFHHAQGAAELDAVVARQAGLSLALRAEGRSVLLHEAEEQVALTDLLAELQALPGVLGVHLVYHHAEPLNDLLREVEA